MDLGLRGRTVFVTVPAEGTGRAITLAFAAEGADLVLAGRDLAAIEPVAHEAAASGVRAETTACDLSDPGHVDAAVGHALAAFGGMVDGPRFREKVCAEMVRRLASRRRRRWSATPPTTP